MEYIALNPLPIHVIVRNKQIEPNLSKIPDGLISTQGP
jgi:hypothetical protein